MNKFKHEMDDFFGVNPRFNKSLKHKMLLNIKEAKSNKFSSKRYGFFKYTAIFAILLSMVTFFLVQAVNETAQETQKPSTGKVEELVVTDTDTVAEIPIFTAYEEPLEIFDFKYDTMDRGNHEYAAQPLLIDPLAYSEKKIARGDVVTYEYKFSEGLQKTISRVIGLPGESVEIVDGHIFVDEQKLETFYSSAHRLGIDSYEEYSQQVEKNTSSTSDTSGMKEIFQTNMKKIQLAENEVFLVGDDWLRGSQHTLKLEKIQGEVIGYYKSVH
ncbi:S26 family signal peptidase [Planococcus sp. S3-L1]|uniref:S26 family signal peptidase n=1 Tax=Planococcus sp. S3-L1 TaxID=3046200 RepID=UPI0024BA519D|nr:S26 family signal peptidase [Planococcus sp. S3-L1]MDJ0333384.1 S26 family signal peptidase [Planococcus sp. S3-L1]